MMEVTEQLYQRWIQYVFDRLDMDGYWYHELELDPFEAEDSPSALTALVNRTCLRSGTDLLRFSDQQVARGLEFIFDNSASDVVFGLKSTSVPTAERLQCIESLWTLYAACLQPRCSGHLSHLNEESATPLNGCCYMLWDVTPLAYWNDHPDKEAMSQAVIALLARVLRLPGQACVESALHGLGHMHLNAAEAVEAVIGDWLAHGPAVRPELLRYATAAREGCVL